MVEKKYLSFGKSLLRSVLILFAAMIIIGIAACIVFYRYAAVYEVTRPELKMDELMESMSASDWYNAADKTSCDSVSDFENTTEIFGRFYDSFCSDKELGYRVAYSENDETEAKFVVRAGNINLYSVTLTAKDDEKPGFGRHYWELGEVKLADFTSSMQYAEVEVYSDKDGGVLINSVPVSEKYYSCDTEWPGISEISQRFSLASTCRKYSIGKVFSELMVTDADGNEIEAEYDSERDVFRYVCHPQIYSVTIEAPDDATVVLCGKELGREDAASVKDSIFKDFAKYTEGNEWDTLVYSFEGIYGEPSVSAHDTEGNELSPVMTDSGRILFFHANDEELQSEAEPSVEQFFNAYMAYSSSHGGVFDLLGCTLRGTRLNNYFRFSTEGMYWASDTDVNYDELEFSNFRRLSDDCLFCTIQFRGNFSAQSWHENYSYEMRNGYEMVFVKSGRIWLAAEMSAFA